METWRSIKQAAMNPTRTDKKLVARRFARSTPTYNRAAIVQREMAGRLVERIVCAASTDSFDRVLELGCGTGLLTNLLVRRFSIGHLVLNDIVPDLNATVERCAGVRPEMLVELRSGDMESIALPANQHLVASNAVLQWAASPITMLEKMVAATRPGGILAIATFGPRNLCETRHLTGASLHYLSRAAIRATLTPHADVIDCDEQIRTLSFASAFELLQHLKRTGVNGLRHRNWSPRAVREFCAAYESEYRIGTEVPLTYHPIIVVARRRDL